MKHYKYSQLVKEYGVSDRTVRNWVEASLEGKIDLKLEEKNGRYYVAESAANDIILQSLAANGKKYRNSRSSRMLEPKAEFYKTFDSQQISDFVNILEKNHELSWHYSYFGQAAYAWNEHLMELHSAGKGNVVSDTIGALKLNYPYIEALIAEYDVVNVVSVCGANAIAVHDVLSRIKASGKLKHFIAADISPEMLALAERNVDRWFGGAITTEKRLMDIRYQPVRVITDEDSISENTVNLYLMVGNPLASFKYPRHALQTLNAGMTKDDILITTVEREVGASQAGSLLDARQTNLLELLNIDQSFYDVERVYDIERAIEHIGITMTVNLAMEFSVGGSRRTVELDRGDFILMRRTHDMSDERLNGLLNRAGFNQLLLAQSLDRSLLMSISQPAQTNINRTKYL